MCVGRKQSTALELRNICHEFVDLNEIRNEIEKKEIEQQIKRGSS